MKVSNLTMVVILVGVIIGCAALAQSDPSPSLGDTLVAMLGLVKSWGSLGIYAAISTALKLIVDFLKSSGLFDKIPASLQAIVVALAGVLTVGLTTLGAGGTLVQAISAGLGSAGGAILLHEIWQDLFPPAPPPALAA